MSYLSDTLPICSWFFPCILHCEPKKRNRTIFPLSIAVFKNCPRIPKIWLKVNFWHHMKRQNFGDNLTLIWFHALYVHMLICSASASFHLLLCSYVHLHSISIRIRIGISISSYDKESDRVTSLSECVPKILTLHRMSKIDFQPDFWNPQMLSFLTNNMGACLSISPFSHKVRPNVSLRATDDYNGQHEWSGVVGHLSRFLCKVPLRVQTFPTWLSS